MAISEKLKNEIEQEIIGLTVIKRPGCGHTDFMTEFSRILAQTNIDKISLENAKFDFIKKTMPVQGGLLAGLPW
jgi:hypothetical protein